MLQNISRGGPDQSGRRAIIIKHIAGWSSQAARRAHNPKVVGSNPTPATRLHSDFVGVAPSQARSKYMWFELAV